VRFLDYKTSYNSINAQIIEFGENILDLKQTVNAEDVITVLIPVGKATDEVKLTITSVNSGSDYLYDSVAVSEFGIIYGYKEWSEITDAATLMTKGQEYLASLTGLSLSLELTALDLSVVDVNIEQIKLGDSIRCVSTPHDLDHFFEVNKLIRYLEEPEKNEISLGAVVRGMTDIQLMENKKV
jgi:phage minor structural protein